MVAMSSSYVKLSTSLVGVMVVLFLGVCTVHLNVAMPDAIFMKSSPKPCGPTRLNSGWIASSKLSCVLHCRTRYGTDCRGFMYNEDSRLCTPSSGLSGRYPVPDVTEGDLYLMTSSDIYPDFGMETSSNNVTAKVAYYTNKLSYMDATAVCACLDSHLYMADIIGKFELLVTMLKAKRANVSVWIGLDDMATEGTYVWSGSGQPLDKSVAFKTKIFSASQPDNYLNNEDCVFMQSDLVGLTDGSCSKVLAYLCEKT